jgi:hypothetical protein
MFAMKTAGMQFLAAWTAMLSRKFFVSAFRARKYTSVQVAAVAVNPLKNHPNQTFLSGKAIKATSYQPLANSISNKKTDGAWPSPSV